MDADGQHEPESGRDLLDTLRKDNFDIIIGSRFLSENKYKMPFPRKLGNILFSWIASRLARRKITDPTSGFQAINRKVLKFFASGIYPSDYPDADVIILLSRIGFRVAELPVVMRLSGSKKSMHSGFLKPLYYVFKMFLSIAMIYLRNNKGH